MPVKTPILTLAFLLASFAFGSSSASAAESGPQWTVTSVSRPTNFKPGDKSGQDAYKVTVTNTGGAASDGSPIQVTDELPEGLSLDARGASGEDQLGRVNVSPGAKLSCVFRSCTYTGVVPADDTLVLTFPVDVASEEELTRQEEKRKQEGLPPTTCTVPAGAVSCVTNVVRVSGGGAPDAAMETPTAIGEEPARFGVSPGGATTALSSTQAGAHPDLTTSIAFNTVNAFGALAGAPKDTVDDLPPGFAGDLVDTPSCSAADFAVGECALATQVGVTTVTLVGIAAFTEVRPVYNLTPEPGQVARLGFTLGSTGVQIQGAVTVRPGDYGLSTSFLNVNQVGDELDNVSLTVWGVPADPIHDPLRSQLEASGRSSFGHPSDAARAPFFTNPTSCGSGPLQASFTVDSWEEPGSSVTAAMSFGPIVGCDRLTMEPSLTVETTTSSAYSPTGLDLGMKIPQTYDNAYGVATSTLEKAVVSLPEGMTVNPSAGAGLGACTEAQLAQEAAQFVQGAGCPNESKLGEVRIVSPAIKEPIAGSVFLASPAPNGEVGRNPFNSLLALYIVARLPDRGIIVKTAGEVTADPLTGRLVTTFDNLPPLPFSTFTFKFHSGATSPLVTPPECGSYTVQAQLTPLAVPGQVLTPAIPPFPITSAFDGGACPAGGVPPFHPQVLAGTQNNKAGSYSSMYLRVIRGDGEQEITGFSSQLPPGLTANLSGVPFCSEAAIALARTKTGAQEESEPSCPPASQIGHTLVGAGVGSVLAQAAGKIYMAGPMPPEGPNQQGSPFSIAAITSAKVGPFDLGTVVVHLPLQINPETAAVTIPAGTADQIPHIIKGIVVHVRDIRVYIDKQSFTLNPTSCERQTFAATVIGSGQSFVSPADDVPVTITDPFQAADCASLAFKPAFKVSTSGKTSRANGASLTAKLTYPTAPVGSQANIARVKVDLPKQLPSRLTTLQKACTAAQFNSNPAGCPAVSFIGHAKAITPILPVPLEGPAIFVSHGGEAFPSLEIVLQGYGVTIDLVGSTFISKSGITSSTFKTVPDQPVTSFELTLPEGKFSALAANGNLCAVTKTVTVKKKVTVRVKGKKKTVTRNVKQTQAASLAMPTEFVGQNGATIHQSTAISVTGCAKAKKAAKKKKGKKNKSSNKKGKK
jgi:uncharacterized repeat protein (TIGR01451 family)